MSDKPSNDTAKPSEFVAGFLESLRGGEDGGTGFTDEQKKKMKELDESLLKHDAS
jgi:hypothetical protein